MSKAIEAFWKCEKNQRSAPEELKNVEGITEANVQSILSFFHS